MNLRKLFTILIVIFPILNIYQLGISSFTLADSLLLITIAFLILDIFKNKRKLNVSNIMLIIFLLIFVQMLIYSIMDINDINAVMTTLRIEFYYFVIALFFKDYFSTTYATKVFPIFATLSSCMLIIQYVAFYRYGIFIRGTVPFLKVNENLSTYINIMSAGLWTSIPYTRPRSFFSEPSHFGVYVTMALELLLSNSNKKNWLAIIIITLGILLSGSTMAIILALLIIVINIIKLFFEIIDTKKLKKKIIMIVIVTLAVSIPCLMAISKTTSFQVFYNRTFVSKDSTDGRFENFSYTFKEKKNVFYVIFGEGITKIEDTNGTKYITSIPRIYKYFGLVGIIISSGLLLYCFGKLKGLNLAAFIILFAISFSSEILFHSLLFVYMPYIVCRRGDLDDKNKYICSNT